MVQPAYRSPLVRRSADLTFPAVTAEERRPSTEESAQKCGGTVDMLLHRGPRAVGVPAQDGLNDRRVLEVTVGDVRWNDGDRAEQFVQAHLDIGHHRGD